MKKRKETGEIMNSDVTHFRKLLFTVEKVQAEETALLDFLIKIAKINTKDQFKDFCEQEICVLLDCDSIRFVTAAKSTYAMTGVNRNHGHWETIPPFSELMIGALKSIKELTRFEMSAYDQGKNLGELMRLLAGNGIKEFVCMPLPEDQGQIDASYFLSTNSETFTADKLAFIEIIGPHLNIVLRHILLKEESSKIESDSSILLDFSNAIAAIRDKQDLFKVIDQKLRNLFPYQDFVICLINDDAITHSAFLYNDYGHSQENKGVAPVSSARYSLDDGLCRMMINAPEPIVFDVEELMTWVDTPVWLEFWYNLGIKEMIGFPVREGDECIGFFYLFAKTRNAISNKNYGLLDKIGRQLSVAIENIKANEKIASQLVEINAYKQQLEGEKLYLEEQINLSGNQTELVGNSPGIKKVFYLIEQVAKSPSTVLILGETGTGKELVARAIHNSSLRKNRLMVKLNCATLPPNLIESELFGHEKGSFTGASEKRIGKFELANNGTLFLDEIGELPMDLQVKLLRVLQEKEIERIGGRTVIKTDVRIIAATNRDLAKEVYAGRFRSDLFYRLNVFPITLPSLRERKEDIPLLSLFFMHKSGKKSGKIVKNISQQVMKSLCFYNWPGNVRELEHQIERCVLLTNGTTIKDIQLPKNEYKESNNTAVGFQVKTIHDNERDHILNILKLCNGKIAGIGGAAEILGIPATTLNSKIKKFKITREHTLK